MDDPGQSCHRAAVDETGLVVPSEPRSVALLRRYAVDACGRLGRRDCADTVALLVSEIAGNAVLHAYGPEIRVRVLDQGLRLRVEIADGSTALPSRRDASARAEDGRGLALVEALAVRWGTDMSHDGKTVWFEVGF